MNKSARNLPEEITVEGQAISFVEILATDPASGEFCTGQISDCIRSQLARIEEDPELIPAIAQAYYNIQAGLNTDNLHILNKNFAPFFRSLGKKGNTLIKSIPAEGRSKIAILRMLANHVPRMTLTQEEPEALFSTAATTRRRIAAIIGHERRKNSVSYSGA